MNPPKLPYNPEVDTFGSRILEIDSKKLTYDEAFRNFNYVDEALRLSRSNRMPIEFTQFVLRKMAVDKKDAGSFTRALDPRARKFLIQLIGPENTFERTVHDPEQFTRTSTFRGLFTRIFCRKVIMNVKQIEDTSFDDCAQIFPFQTSKNVPKYDIHVSNYFDDKFYNDIQYFLNNHFNNADARNIIPLFLNNIRHFSESKLLSKHPSESEIAKYLRTIPGLNETGIAHFYKLYDDYRNVRKYYEYFELPELNNCNREYFQKLPENNLKEILSLLKSNFYKKHWKIYTNVFKKYLFFFVHAIEANSNRIFFIDEMMYNCLLRLYKYKKVNEDIRMVKDLAVVCLLELLSPYKNDYLIFGGDEYTMNLVTLKNMKRYITRLISGKDIEVNIEFKTDYDLCGIMRYRIDDACFNIHYSTNNRNRLDQNSGINRFIDRIVASAVLPGDHIKYVIAYNAYKGVESKFTMPRDIDSIRNFIRLSSKPNYKLNYSPVQLNDDFLKFFSNSLSVSKSSN